MSNNIHSDVGYQASKELEHLYYSGDIDFQTYLERKHLLKRCLLTRDFGNERTNVAYASYMDMTVEELSVLLIRIRVHHGELEALV
tara:strand:- start:309 stop:566 length:258 start_codon:yes stop_codon:yes gene_type:complete